jgi:hypothetical protein
MKREHKINNASSQGSIKRQRKVAVTVEEDSISTFLGCQCMVWTHESFVGEVASLWWRLGAEVAARDQGWIERQRKAVAEGGFEFYASVVYCERMIHLQGQRLLCGSV